MVFFFVFPKLRLRIFWGAEQTSDRKKRSADPIFSSYFGDLRCIPQQCTSGFPTMRGAKITGRERRFRGDGRFRQQEDPVVSNTLKGVLWFVKIHCVIPSFFLCFLVVDWAGCFLKNQ